MSTPAAVALIGMPGTGKSTFLAALYNQLIESKPDDRFGLIRMPWNRTYLEALQESWLAGQAVGRTTLVNGEVIELDVQAGGKQFQLLIPDIAGEAFEAAFIRRQIEEAIADLIRNASGLLLFLHPDHLRPRVLISQVKQIAASFGEDPPSSPARAFDPRLVPGEVQIVDLLQCIADLRSEPCRLGLLVSAWDRCVETTPSKWIESKMPMLWNYLKAHEDTFDHKIFGVSAQGGEYGGDNDPSEIRPYERAFIVDSLGQRSFDLTCLPSWAAIG